MLGVQLVGYLLQGEEPQRPGLLIERLIELPIIMGLVCHVPSIPATKGCATAEGAASSVSSGLEGVKGRQRHCVKNVPCRAVQPLNSSPIDCRQVFSFYWLLLWNLGLVFESHIGLDTGQGCVLPAETAMTELLIHPATPLNATSTPNTTSTAPAAAPSLTLLAGPDRAKTSARLAWASQSGTIDTEQLTAWVESQQESDDSPTDDEPLTPADLASLSIRRLRMLVNQAYTLMDTDYPPSRTVDRYEMLADELERRAEATEKRHPVNTTREKFRDNSLSSRFELFIDGHLVAYMQYRMNGGDLTLILGNELPGFRNQGVATTLMRAIVLDAHKRRLNLIPRCPMAYAFLADNPQYQQYTSHHATHI